MTPNSPSASSTRPSVSAINPDEYVQRAQEAGQLGAIYADVRRGKALAGVVRQATVTDASGQTLDLSELFGTGDDSSQAADSASNEDTASDEGSSEDGASKDADESSSTTDR